MNPSIDLKGVFFRYSGHEPDGEKEIFNNFSLSVERGARLIIRGESGAGKTTFLRLLALLEEPCGGEIFFNGKPYCDYHPTELRRSVSLVQQVPVMLEGTVRDNLLLGCNADDSTISQYLERFGLQNKVIDQNAKSLSVGQAQRVAVIRNILVKPQVLLLDEPTSGLDPESTSRFIEAVKHIASEEGVTVIWNSHHVDTLKDFSTDMVTIGEGRG